MVIIGAEVIQIHDLYPKRNGDYFRLFYANAVGGKSNPHLVGVSWKYGTGSFQTLREAARKAGARWNREYWVFRNSEAATEFFDHFRRLHPDWPVISNSDGRHALGETTYAISREMEGGVSALIVSFPFPQAAQWSGLDLIDLFRPAPPLSTLTASNRSRWLLAVGNTLDIGHIAATLAERGAREGQKPQQIAGMLSTGKQVQVKASGWAVELTFDLLDVKHHQVTNGLRGYTAKSWDGKIHTTRKKWGDWKKRLAQAGLEWDGDDPEAEVAVSSLFDPSLVPGWASPAPNGYLLHEFQKEGIKFCATRGWRVLIGDEMGVGKTAQAIGAAEACQAPRVVVICPASARYVWEREIKGWGRGGAIQHVQNQLDVLDQEARWHILTYDQAVARIETWKIVDEREEKAVLAVFPEHSEDVRKHLDYPKPVKFGHYTTDTPNFQDKKRAAAWKKMMRRLKGELLGQLLTAGPAMVILDEAHRMKNRDAKRTKAIQLLTADKAHVLLLTGTPLRNNEHEAAALLGLLDSSAAFDLSRRRGYTIQDVKDYLSYLMIRRTKKEVLPELPDKTRQRVDIDKLGDLRSYYEALDRAREVHKSAIERGSAEGSARMAMRGALEQARQALGLAKVRGGEVLDLVMDVVENKGSCVVFCFNRQVGRELHSQLSQAGLAAGVVHGRIPVKQRAQIVSDFADGRLDVFIGALDAAGEAITLHRSDTVVFLQLHWVPAAMMQAEDRIHRNGQKENCQIIHLIARFPGENLDEMMIEVLGSKMERIGIVLDESTENVVAQKQYVQDRIIDRLLDTSRELREGHKTTAEGKLQPAGKPGPGRPSLPDAERKRRAAISKRVWRQKNIEKQREYHRRWKEKNAAPKGE